MCKQLENIIKRKTKYEVNCERNKRHTKFALISKLSNTKCILHDRKFVWVGYKNGDKNESENKFIELIIVYYTHLCTLRRADQLSWRYCSNNRGEAEICYTHPE
jgi:hypothetical protein